MTDFVDVAAATTTSEQDRKSAGQRRINVVWELTQSFVAVSVTSVTLGVAALLARESTQPNASVTTISSASIGFALLSNAFFLVIGFYFGRTNHARTGGVGGDSVRDDR